jgi:glutamate synthase (NADPH/NADH) small chain
MGKPTGFIELPRAHVHKRPVEERVKDWKEIYTDPPEKELREQGSRCMDCGVPFCNQGCPLGNIIPEWNDLVYRGRWREALDRLLATNNFPEWTGRLCPAPCENACVLAIDGLENAVTIKNVELAIIERAFQEGWIKPEPPKARTGKRVAVVGSGPAGLTVADQLNRVGHSVTVFERSDRIGGLLRYGIPEFKMEKRFLERRLEIMEAEGVVFRTGVNVGGDIPVEKLRSEFDAIMLAAGALWGRDVELPGRELKGIVQAMDYLTRANRLCEGDRLEVDDPDLNAEGKNVVILGGGDTGADCLGSAVRQGARSIVQWDYNPMPPKDRNPDNPWPEWARVLRSYGAHDEADEIYGAASDRPGVVGIREYQVFTKGFSGEGGHVRRIHGVKGRWVRDGHGKRHCEEQPGSAFTHDADLVLLAIGFRGTERTRLITDLGVALSDRGNVVTDADKMTSVQGVFAAGDMTRGASLIVWAIAEGRVAARGIDKYLMGRSDLPTPDYR